MLIMVKLYFMTKIFYFFIIYVFSFNVQSQRNVILIIADDIGTDYFGFYEDGKDTVDVPNIRGLLKKGIRFSNAMSNPVCSSTRAGILTGRYSFRTKVGGIVGGEGGSNPLDTSEITIARLLDIFNPNIAKANIGKWHLHQAMPITNLKFPNVLGYDHYEGGFIGQLTSYTNWTKHTNGIASTITNYATSENVDNAVSWIKLQKANSFFLWLAFNAPHAPFHLPPANLHKYSNLSGTNQDIMQNPKSYFKAALQAMDTELGRLIDSLRVMNRLDSTDFIFIGDNGNEIRTVQIVDSDRAKGTVYQYGVHVPFIISGPSVIEPNRTSDALVNTVDIFATVLELFGMSNWSLQIQPNKPVDSKSILPILKNTNTEIRPWSFCEIFRLMPDSRDGKAMRNFDYKLFRFDDGRQEFYHLKNDPEEHVDLLKRSLNNEDVTNYYYLCNEMTNLLGTGSLCKQVVGIQVILKLNKFAYPNPFISQIQVFPEYERDLFHLINGMGQSVFIGNDIIHQDFSNLPKGLYVLKNVNIRNQTIKLLKE